MYLHGAWTLGERNNSQIAQTWGRSNGSLNKIVRPMHGSILSVTSFEGKGILFARLTDRLE